MLGVLPEATYAKRVHRLEEGELILLYTDGAVEAMNSDDEQFGLDRLMQSISTATAEPGAVIRAVNRGISAHLGGEEQADDKTLVALSAQWTQSERGTSQE